MARPIWMNRVTCSQVDVVCLLWIRKQCDMPHLYITFPMNRVTCSQVDVVCVLWIRKHASSIYNMNKEFPWIRSFTCLMCCMCSVNKETMWHASSIYNIPHVSCYVFTSGCSMCSVNKETPYCDMPHLYITFPMNHVAFSHVWSRKLCNWEAFVCAKVIVQIAPQKWNYLHYW